MQEFSKQLTPMLADEKGRKWLYVSYDQLNERLGPLAREEPSSLGVILIESGWQVSRRPYHKQKLAYLWSNMRHFALEQARRGVAVRYLAVDEPFSTTLRAQCAELGTVRLMNPAERELRMDLQPLVEQAMLGLLPHDGWLTTRSQFEKSQKRTPWRMDAFYRYVRRDKGILMENGKPLGGKFSFDAENRLPWRGEPPAPDLPAFEPDPITQEVGQLIKDRFSNHPGQLDLASLPSTKADADRLWTWAKEECLEHFGPFEDAMSSRATNLFHTRVSSLLNLGRLTPQQLLLDVLALDIGLSSKEGFVRQLLGWREFMHHVHEVTDGFRKLSGFPQSSEGKDSVSPSFLKSDQPLPPAYWGTSSGLQCLDQVVSDVWREGYSHHITRLMVLSNLATLLDLSPRELTDWFWCAYTDAYDWVVEPNVLGMGTFALGNLFTTKPYVSGSAYIKKMSDYCSSCQFDPDENCPISSLYWAFLERHQAVLRDNPRMRIVFASLRKRSSEKKKLDRKIFEVVRGTLSEGRELVPKSLALS
jgi:deoxyribodipyrimidine photolyase-related protein